MAIGPCAMASNMKSAHEWPKFPPLMSQIIGIMGAGSVISGLLLANDMHMRAAIAGCAGSGNNLGVLDFRGVGSVWYQTAVTTCRFRPDCATRPHDAAPLPRGVRRVSDKPTASASANGWLMRSDGATGTGPKRLFWARRKPARAVATSCVTCLHSRERHALTHRLLSGLNCWKLTTDQAPRH